ncbi:MAG TPA: hypothetical protein VKK31_11220 [Thermoanaerobaculia bacterium]|nr:hypothetical protein [Thermoanaerobaculia bacterium]
MARAKVSSTRVRSWDLLNESLKPLVAEMPHVQPLLAELQGMLDGVRSLDKEQEDARSKLRDLVRRRQDAEQQGEVVRRRVEAHLRGTFGYTSEELIRFGIKPRPRVIRRKAAEKQRPALPAEASQKPQSA